MISEDTQTTGARTGLAAVMKGFPEHNAALQRLFLANPSFQSLCGDYADCLAALKHWEQSNAKEAPDMRGAYVDLLGELEQEVRQYLEYEEASGFSPGKR
jgi:hypothetical protein